MLRDDADFFSTRYEDMVREPDATWREWVAEAAAGEQKTLFVAEEDGAGSASSARSRASTRARCSSSRCGSTPRRAAVGSHAT